MQNPIDFFYIYKLTTLNALQTKRYNLYKINTQSDLILTTIEIYINIDEMCNSLLNGIFQSFKLRWKQQTIQPIKIVTSVLNNIVGKQDNFIDIFLSKKMAQ